MEIKETFSAKSGFEKNFPNWKNTQKQEMELSSPPCQVPACMKAYKAVARFLKPSNIDTCVFTDIFFSIA